MSPARRDFSTRSRRTGPSRGERLLLLLAAVACAAASGAALGAWRDEARARAAVAAAERRRDQTRARVAELERSQGPGEALAFQALLTAEAPPVLVLADVAALLPPDVRLDGVTMAYADRLALDLHVVARSPEAYEAFVRNLVASPRFAEVTPREEVRAGDVRSVVRARHAGVLP